MTDKGVKIKIYTPSKLVLDDVVDFVILRTNEGDMGVMPGHEPYSALLDYGMLRMFVEKAETGVFMVLGGFVTVMNNEVVVLSDMAERPEELQTALDALEREREANLLREATSDLDIQRAEMVLRQSLVQMDISSYSIIKGRDEKP